MGAFWEAFWLPKGVPKSIKFASPSKDAPKRPQESSQEAPRSPQRTSRGSKSSPKRPQRVPREPSRGTKSPHPQDRLTTKPPNQQAVKQSNQCQGGRRHRAPALKSGRFPSKRVLGLCETTRGTFSYSLKLKNDRILRILSYFPKEKYLGGAPPLAPAPNVGNFRGVQNGAKNVSKSIQKSMKILIRFLIAFCSSWGRFWGGLGSLFGSFFVPGSLLNASCLQKRRFSKSNGETNRKSSFFRPQTTPKTSQNRPKRLPRELFFRLRFRLRFWNDFGPILDPFWLPNPPPLGTLFGAKID